jgi:hypothetical protein
VGAGIKELGFQISYTPSGTAGANDWVQFEQVQLEQGLLTGFEKRSYETELQLCQRYLYAVYNNAASGTILPGAAVTASTTSAVLNMPLKVPMRIPPTTATASTATNFSVSNGTTVTAATAVAISGTASTEALNIAFTVASGLTAGQAMFAEFNTATATLLTISGAEL